MNAGSKRAKNTSPKLSPTISANPLDEMLEEQYNKKKRASQNLPKSKKSLFVHDQHDVDGESEGNLETSEIRCMNTEKINQVSERFRKLNKYSTTYLFSIETKISYIIKEIG